jgi:hypothetical protein
MSKYAFLASCIASLVLCCSGAYGQSPAPADDVEDIYVLRSVRLSRDEPTEFCSQSRTTFADAQFEDTFSLVPVATHSKSGLVTGAVGTQVGSSRGCFGRTSDPAVRSFYVEGELKGIRFTGIGTCSTIKSDFPEPGIQVLQCFLNLSGLPTPYVGGLLTANTIFSRKVLGYESDPRGYVEPSIATIRLWKWRPVHSRGRDKSL